MLALLNELRQTLGWRGFAAILAVVVVSVFAFDITTNARAYYEMYTQAQNAQWAALKAQAEAEKAKYESDAAKAIAENAAKQKAAEADKANAEARTAERGRRKNRKAKARPLKRSAKTRHEGKPRKPTKQWPKHDQRS
jgi:hypothetical protein